MEFAEEYSMLASSGAGSLRAGERLVRGHQAEVQRAAYLLSGEPHAARWFARRAFLTYLQRNLDFGGDATEQRERLLVALMMDYLQACGDGERPPPPETPRADAEPDRFDVDDQRGRIMDALDRLEPPTRAALVLREFSALPEETICQTLDLAPYDLRDGLEPARARLRDAAGVRPDAPVQPLLAQAAMREPVTDIWPDLEDAVQRLYDRQAARRRWLIAGAGLATVLLLLAGTVWLFGFNAFSPNETESRAIAAMPTRDQPTMSLEAPDSPPPPTPTPEPTMPDLPVGNVPDRLIMTLDVLEGETEFTPPFHESRQALFDPTSGDLQMINAPREQFLPSRDGKWLVYRHYLAGAGDGGQDQLALTVIDAQTGARAWFRTFPSLTTVEMAGDVIYAVYWEEFPKMLAIEIATGDTVAERSDLLGDMGIEFGTQSRFGVVIRASPDGSELIAAINYEVAGERADRLAFTTFALPELEPQNTVSWAFESNEVDAPDLPQYFPFRDAEYTPDGSALYAPDGDSVQFLTIDQTEPVILEIPFRPPSEYAEFGIRWVVSNDGRYLYALALARMEVAIIDLLTKSLVVVAPIDHGRYSLLPDTDNPAFANEVANWGVDLSPDGRRLYVLGGWDDLQQPVEDDRTAIWVVDVATWRVIDRLEIPGWPGGLMWTLGGDRMIIRSRPTDAKNEPPGFEDFIVFEADTGEVLPGLDPTDFPDEVDGIYTVMSIEQQYRNIYDRSPVIDAVLPETVETSSTLPRLEVIADQALVPSGGVVKLDLRILDPASGQPLDGSSANVRFDPSVNPMLVLRQRENGAETILVPSRVEPGRYSGIAPVEQVGHWDVEVRFVADQNNVTSANLFEVFTVTPSIPGDDGELYSLRVQAEPGSPAESEEWTVRASVVNIDTGQVLPEGVTLELDLSDHLTVTFEHEEYVFFTSTLDEARHGVYEGKARFRGPGSWTPSVTLRAPSSAPVSMTIQTGTVVVGQSEP